MTATSVPAPAGLHKIWYYDGEGENTCELVVLRDPAEVAFAERMYADLYGSDGPVEVVPCRDVPTLAGLVEENLYDPADFEED